MGECCKAARYPSLYCNVKRSRPAEQQDGDPDLLDAVFRAMKQSNDRADAATNRSNALFQIASLTRRQRQVMDMVLAGQINKIIAADLGISQRTVENHRASIMEKTGARSIPELVRMVLAAPETQTGHSGLRQRT